MIQREAADKLAEAEKRLKDAESINDNFFIETIHEMRTPLFLVLGSLALVVQNDDPEKDMSTQSTKISQIWRAISIYLL